MSTVRTTLLEPGYPFSNDPSWHLMTTVTLQATTERNLLILAHEMLPVAINHGFRPPRST